MFNRFRKFAGRINKALNDPDRKSVFRIFTEYAGYKISNAAIAEQYFEKYLYRKDIGNPDEFIVTRKVMADMWKLNNVHYVSILKDKYLTELFFTGYGIPVVKSLAYNRSSLFFRNGRLYQVDKVEDFKKFLLSLNEEGHWDTEYLIIKKKSDSAEGKNIFRISVSDILKNNDILQHVFSEILKSEYLFQNFITQHPELNRLNPRSVNTVRIDTFTNQEGEIQIYNSMLRTGSGNHFIDNVSQGGLAIGIDQNRGVLFPESHTFFTGYNPAKSRYAHPVSGTLFEGFQVPYFNEAKQLAVDAAEKLPQVKLAGWDIAIQPDGPVLIEGNNNSAIPLYEVLQKGYKNNAVVVEILKETYNFQNNNKYKVSY